MMAAQHPQGWATQDRQSHVNLTDRCRVEQQNSDAKKRVCHTWIQIGNQSPKVPEVRMQQYRLWWSERERMVAVWAGGSYLDALHL
jgi:hypothetical protein